MNEFSALGLSQPLVDAIEELGFVQPTPIQSKAIPQLLNNDTDLVGLAQTGTGKTAAFGLPLVELVDPSEKHTQAIVLAPTRELCLQIAKELKQFGKHFKQLKIKEVYGGTDIGKQIREIKRGAHIIVATPGRLRDMINRRVVAVEQIEYVVLDEADEMLNMGFKEELDDILENTPDDKLTWLFSATMPDEVRRISKSYMTDPLELSVGKRNTANADIDHQFIVVRRTEKYEALRRFLDFDPNIFGLIFCRTRRDSKELADKLARDGYNSDALHGDLNQVQRDRVMERFRTRRIQILVATDVAARGIDVQDISYVFHYNIPDDKAFYTHRSGRTGRAGNKGISLILCHPKDIVLIRDMERKLRIKFSRAHIPTGKEICESRLKAHFEAIKELPANEAIKPFLDDISADLEDLTKEELIEKFATFSFDRFFKTYSRSVDLNLKEKDRERPRRTGRMKNLFINVGSIDVENKGGFLSFVCENANIPGSVIGKINLQHKHSFFDVEEGVANQVIERLSQTKLDGRPIRINAGDRNTSDKKLNRRAKRDKRFKKRASN